MFSNKNTVNVILVIVMLSVVVVVSGCSGTFQKDEGGKVKVSVLTVETESTPSSTTIALGSETSEGTVTPIAMSFNDSRSKVQAAKALRYEVIHGYKGSGNFNSSSSGSGSVSGEANRLMNK